MTPWLVVASVLILSYLSNRRLWEELQDLQNQIFALKDVRHFLKEKQQKEAKKISDNAKAIVRTVYYISDYSPKSKHEEDVVIKKVEEVLWKQNNGH